MRLQVGIGFILGPFVLFAQAETRFQASLDREEVGVNERVHLILEVTSDQRHSEKVIPQFEAPDFERVGSQSSTSFVSRYDGTQGSAQIQQKQRFQFSLKPKKIGM